MSASEVLKDFRHKRNFLENLGEQHATERLASMWEFLVSRDETRQIISKIQEGNAGVLGRIRSGQAAKAGPEGEIYVVGLYVMERCHSSKENVPSIAKQLGIVSTRGAKTSQSYVDDAMNGYVHHALDFVEEELVHMVNNEREKENSNKILTNQGRVPDRHTAKHNTLKKRFEDFLVRKGYRFNDPNSGLVTLYDAGPMHELPDIAIHHGNKRILMAELEITDNVKALESAKLLLDRYQYKKSKNTVLAFIAVWAENDYGFEIYAASGVTKPTKISHDAFPLYKNLMKPRKDRAYGEGRYGEGVYGSDEDNESNHRKLQNAFIEFLKKVKDCPPDSIKNLAGGELLILDVDSKKTKVFVDFTLSNEQSVITRTLDHLRLSALPGLVGYLICPTSDNSSEPFEILNVTDNDYETISKEDFPDYEDLRKEPVSVDASGGYEPPFGEGENRLVKAFMGFLENDKGYPSDSMQLEKRGMNPKSSAVMDMALIVPETENEAAVIEFVYSNDDKILADAHFRINRYRRSLNQSDIPAYILCPAERKSRYAFGIYEVFEEDPPFQIESDTFPTYNQMLFENLTSGKGRRLCRSLVELARDKHGLSIYAPCKDYINLQIKKNKRTAAQIHRLNNSDKDIALVLAGYQEVFPISKSEPYVVRGEIGQLSGNTSKYPKEMAWLNGNVGHELLRYQAGVYIIKPGSLVLEEIQDEVGELLDLAKRKAESKGLAEFELEDIEGTFDFAIASKDKSKSATVISDVIGDIATIRVEGIGDEDRLGREKLVKTLAGLFEKTECDNGFTMALLGDWGQGKSTVMQLLKNELEKKHKGKFEFAMYNAWEYENTDNIAAGVAQEVVSGINKRLKFLEGLKLRFYFAMLEYGQDIRRVILYIVGAIVVLWLASKIGGPNTLKDYGVATGWVALLIFVFINIVKMIEHPVSVKLETYLRLPNYGKHLGLIPVLRRHVSTLCALRLRRTDIRLTRRWLVRWRYSANKVANSKRKIFWVFKPVGKLGEKVLHKWWIRFKTAPVETKSLVLFVDDLDRCNVDHISKVLDAIRLVMTIPNVIVMIGIDHNIAFKAVGKHYELLAEKEDGSKRTSAVVARDYLGKIIQLPLRLMPASNAGLKMYVEKKLFDEDNLIDDRVMPEKTEQTDAGTSDNPTDDSSIDTSETMDRSSGEKQNGEETEEEAVEEKISKAIQDTIRERDRFSELAKKYEFRNPRQLLRLHNSFRFLKGFGSGQGKDGDNTLDMLEMLFWQEFLHNWPMKVRGWCMAALVKEEHVAKIEAAKAKKVLENVREEIAELFNKEGYHELAKFVRVVVLPHNEEGVLDSREEIEDWMTKEEKKKEEEKN